MNICQLCKKLKKHHAKGLCSICYKRVYIPNYDKEWAKNNPEKVNEHRKRTRKKYPDKLKARLYAYYHKQRDTKCYKCNSTENLHFHHIDYEKRKGITLCRKCHDKIHTGQEK